MSATSKPLITLQKGEPAWAIAELFPPQGYWDDEEYLSLTDGTNHLVELTDGRIEVLAMPTEKHQEVLEYLFLALKTVAQLIGGKVHMAALRIRLSSGNFREPDLILLRSATDPRRHNRYWDGADLVVEVLSDSAEDRYRDLVTKREEYARAGIQEYWIADPQSETITVLTLRDQQYSEHGVFGRDMTATSPMLFDLHIDVSAVFDAA